MDKFYSGPSTSLRRLYISRSYSQGVGANSKLTTGQFSAGVNKSVGFDRFHLVGHSMGGLTALMLADRVPDRVLSFTDIEGNVASEDCFLSRQIDQFPDEDAVRFFDRFVERARHAPAFSSALYATSLKHKVRAAAVPSIFRSMVQLSDYGDLMRRFLQLPCPKMFMYGDQNQHLSYLGHLEHQGVSLACIPHCGHFPMYSNPEAMWGKIWENIYRT